MKQREIQGQGMRENPSMGWWWRKEGREGIDSLSEV
jgi:hypothetical protein